MSSRKTKPSTDHIARAIDAVEQLAAGGNLRAVRMLADGTLERLREILDHQVVDDAPPPPTPPPVVLEPHPFRTAVKCPLCSLWFSAVLDPTTGRITDAKKQNEVQI